MPSEREGGGLKMCGPSTFKCESPPFSPEGAAVGFREAVVGGCTTRQIPVGFVVLHRLANFSGRAPRLAQSPPYGQTLS